MRSSEESRYTPTELMNPYYEFMRDKEVWERLNKDDIRWWQDTELTLRFIGYVRNDYHLLRMRETDEEFQRVVELNERRKSRLFGEPTKGDLFKENP
jgi:hypothetical protein